MENINEDNKELDQAYSLSEILAAKVILHSKKIGNLSDIIIR